MDAAGIMDMSWAWTAGAMVSNTRDLCRWADALYRGGVLGSALRAKMLTKTTLPDGSTADYGLGVQFRTRGGLPVVGHNGSTMGFDAELFLHVPSGLCVAVLTNDFGGKPSAVSAAAWTLLVGKLGLP